LHGVGDVAALREVRLHEVHILPSLRVVIVLEQVDLRGFGVVVSVGVDHRRKPDGIPRGYVLRTRGRDVHLDLAYDGKINW